MINIFKIINFKYKDNLNTSLFFDIDESKPINKNGDDASIRPIIIFYDDKKDYYYYLRCRSKNNLNNTIR